MVSVYDSNTKLLSDWQTSKPASHDPRDLAEFQKSSDGRNGSVSPRARSFCLSMFADNFVVSSCLSASSFKSSSVRSDARNRAFDLRAPATRNEAIFISPKMLLLIAALLSGEARSFAAAAKKGFSSSSSVAPKKKKKVAMPLPEGGNVRKHAESMPQFMGAYMMEESVADGVMNLFERTPQLRGMVSTAGGTAPVVDTTVKDSLEISVPPNDPSKEWKAYLASLNECIKLYLETYPYAGAYGKFGLISRTNVQRYPCGGGYKTFHTERTGAGEPEGSRHLVFMTYLNTLTDEGGTEFYHQDLITQPQKGLTLIWPSGWEFTHRGVPSPTQEKTITTGWFNFLSQ